MRQLTDHDKRQNVSSIEYFEVYKNDVRVVRSGTRPEPAEKAKRGEIIEWTSRAQKRLAFVAANTDAEFQTMITLTYPDKWNKDGKEVKRHLNLFLKRFFRKYHGSYLWFLEFQERGAPHYHILLTFAAVAIDKEWLSMAWYEIVDSGDYNHFLAGSRVEKLRKKGARYAVKYAYKMRQKEVPELYQNVGRFYGYSQDVKPKAIAEVWGNIDEIFQGVEDYDTLLENGYSTLFGLAGEVASNMVKGEQNEGIQKTVQLSQPLDRQFCRWCSQVGKGFGCGRDLDDNGYCGQRIGSL